MIYKERFMPEELEIFKALKDRVDFSMKDHKRFMNMLRGYEGEQLFDEFTRDLACECYQLNDLTLKHIDTVFQIDALLITEEKLLLYEVKNYHGEFSLDGQKLLKLPKFEVVNPLNQLGKMTSVFKQLLHQLGMNFKVESHVIFVNPEFTLYQARKADPIILPTQIKQHFQTLNESPSQLSPHHKRLADKLVELQLDESPYRQLPTYNQSQIRKGILCSTCRSSKIFVDKNHVVCRVCNQKESLNSALTTLVKDFKLLFPDRKLTTTSLFEWSGGVLLKSRIAYYLKSNYERRGNNRGTYYV